ncbi:hypothetical protein TNIN_388211 [Trichonephila inaurata madagascariensis]|uniref:Uncharacterized protein n=1 Tax=Trichonephila inaurata madagascariensis TaxID=2747483 RepID=A0A8X7C1K1_9ARAC|nr:hypothetical protein TNIN_388211 [Trichonephila inaurata madagascariensis]
MIWKSPTNHNDDNQFARCGSGSFSQEKETVAVYKCFKTESQGSRVTVLHCIKRNLFQKAYFNTVEMDMKHPPQVEGHKIITHPLHIKNGRQKLAKRHG